MRFIVLFRIVILFTLLCSVTCLFLPGDKLGWAVASLSLLINIIFFKADYLIMDIGKSIKRFLKQK